MRTICIDWMKTIIDNCGRILFLATNIFDRFLSNTHFVIAKKQLQLVGAASYFIAVKYESNNAVQQGCTAKWFSFLAKNSFSAKQVIHMESTILACLQFQLNAIIPFDFLDLFMDAVSAGVLCTVIEKQTTKLLAAVETTFSFFYVVYLIIHFFYKP